MSLGINPELHPDVELTPSSTGPAPSAGAAGGALLVGSSLPAGGARPEGVAYSSSGEVLFVGPSARFLSGISYYTARAARAFCEHDAHGGSLLWLRRLCPERIYPGRERIGAHGEEVLGVRGVARYDGLDWFWGLSMVHAVLFLWRRRPEAMVLQWWTGTVAHSYLLLAIVARVRGVRVVIEFHETLDVGEAAKPGVARYVKIMMRALSAFVDGFVVHSRGDIGAVQTTFPSFTAKPFQVIHHGPFDHIQRSEQSREGGEQTRYVFFGVLRQYKGITELVEAFEMLLRAGEDAVLCVAGEPWPECAEELELLRALPAGRVELRLGHLSDDEVSEVLSGADVVVLPYRRSSASGPLHIAMAMGLTVVTTDVAALAEVCEGYSGAVLCPPADPEKLFQAMRDAAALRGVTHSDPHSWESNVGRYRELLARIGSTNTGVSTATTRTGTTIAGTAEASTAVSSTAMSSTAMSSTDEET